jgi:hypothetical protein
MLKKAMFLLAFVVTMFSISSVVFACEGADCTHDNTYNNNIVFYTTIDLSVENGVSDEVRELIAMYFNDSVVTQRVVKGINRIYSSDHIFGEDEILDKLFSCGRLFVEFFTISIEYLNESGIIVFSSSQCSIGRHTNVHILFTDWWLVCVNWSQQGASNGGDCTLMMATSWICLDCRTTGRDSSVALVFCRDC